MILRTGLESNRVVRFVREQGIEIPDHLLAQVAPIPWEHIGITGDYLWNEIDQPLERFRPLRTNRFNPKGFIFPQRVSWNRFPRYPGPVTALLPLVLKGDTQDGRHSIRRSCRPP